MRAEMHIVRSLVLRAWWNGRHAGLRSLCRKAWGFESPRAHQYGILKWTPFKYLSRDALFL